MKTRNPYGKGWHNRGYLPHFDSYQVSQFVTFRLADSLSPEEREHLSTSEIEKLLDRGYGCCVLRDPAAALIVANALKYFDGERYRLHSWVIMPNHVHTLLTVEKGFELGKVIWSWKSFTAHEILKLHKNPGPLWQREYFDRVIRDRDHFESAMSYVMNNPVKAKLCDKPEDWIFSSAHQRKR